MRIPDSAADGPLVDGEDGAVIVNKYFGKEFLTRLEAIDIINELSGMLLIDGNCGRYKQSERGDPGDI